MKLLIYVHFRTDGTDLSPFWFAIFLCCGHVFTRTSNYLFSRCDCNVRMKIWGFLYTGHAYYGKFGKLEFPLAFCCRFVNSLVITNMTYTCVESYAPSY